MHAVHDRLLAGARPLRDRLYGDLVWRRPGVFARSLDLESGSERLATLRWTRIFRFDALTETGEGMWKIAPRSGLGRGRVVVRDAETDTEVAELARGWRGTGTVRFTSGAEYAWKRDGFWRPEYFWASARAERLVTFKTRLGWTTRYEMTVDPSARDLRELPVLVLLGAYVMALMSAQSQAS